MPQKSCISEIDTTGIATSRMGESALEVSIDNIQTLNYISQKSVGLVKKLL